MESFCSQYDVQAQKKTPEIHQRLLNNLICPSLTGTHTRKQYSLSHSSKYSQSDWEWKSDAPNFLYNDEGKQKCAEVKCKKQQRCTNAAKVKTVNEKKHKPN